MMMMMPFICSYRNKNEPKAVYPSFGETVRAEAQLDLQQVHKKGAVNEYLQSLWQRGHVGLANAGLTILNAGDQSI